MDSKKAVKQLKVLERMIKDKRMRLAAQWPEKWQILIATILSAMTKDEVTIEICEVLFKKYPSPAKLGRASIYSIEKIIRPVNYYKTKARHIKKTCQIIGEGEIPDKLEDLIKYPGVGRKVGNVYLAEAHKADVIGVDTHVARISQKLGWTKNSNPHKIEKDLEKLFPKKYWRKINETLVTFGKSVGINRKHEDEILARLTKE